MLGAILYEIESMVKVPPEKGRKVSLGDVSVSVSEAGTERRRERGN